MNSPRKLLIVNADDLGLCQAVNLGITHAHCHGIVTSASLMANMPGVAHGASVAAELPGLGVGVHVNLTWGPPLTGKSSLTRGEDSLPGKWKLARMLICGRVDSQDLRREIQAQVAHCLQLGVQPSHMDTHHHVHAHPAVYAAMVQVAREFNIPFVRLPVERRPSSLTALGLSAAALFSASKVGRLAPACGRSFQGISLSGKWTAARLLALLAALPPGLTELMCHPGEVDASLPSNSRLKQSREEEIRILTMPEIRQCLVRHEITLINYRNCKEGIL